MNCIRLTPRFPKMSFRKHYSVSHSLFSNIMLNNVAVNSPLCILCAKTCMEVL